MDLAGRGWLGRGVAPRQLWFCMASWRGVMRAVSGAEGFVWLVIASVATFNLVPCSACCCENGALALGRQSKDGIDHGLKDGVDTHE